MSQTILVIEWVKKYGSILPAKMGGRAWRKGVFGSETTKRCRELRAVSILRSEWEGRFKRFFLTREAKKILKN